MAFIESSNITSLVFKHEKYYLNIKTKYEDNNQAAPTDIDVNITVVKIINNQRFYAETLELIFNLKTKMYSALSEIGSLSSLLYDNIITKLNDILGDKKGCESY